MENSRRGRGIAEGLDGCHERRSTRGSHSAESGRYLTTMGRQRHLALHVVSRRLSAFVFAPASRIQFETNTTDTRVLYGGTNSPDTGSPFCYLQRERRPRSQRSGS